MKSRPLAPSLLALLRDQALRWLRSLSQEVKALRSPALVPVRIDSAARREHPARHRSYRE